MGIEQKIKIIPRKKIKDTRGWFLKVITGQEEGLPAYTGEVYLTNASPNEAKGGHYHPVAKEWFTIITGSCQVKLVDVLTGEKFSLILTAEQPVTLFVPNNIAHVFVNEGDKEFILLAYSDQLYLPEDTISFNTF